MYSRQLQLPVSLSMVTHVSKGTNCTNAEIRVTATFLTDSRNFICSGTISNAMTVSYEAQTFNIEIRPFTQNEFLRWRNQPGVRGVPQGKQLTCTNYDGRADITDDVRSKAMWLQVGGAVMASDGGLAVLEVLVQINP